MFLIRSLLLISLFFTVLLAKDEVSKIFAHKEKASTLTYTSYDEKEYQYLGFYINNNKTTNKMDW